MDGWLGYLIGLSALLVLAPLAAWLGLRHGRSVKGAAGLALVMLGFGRVMDPPAQRLIEAVGGEKREGEAAGEPKDPTSGH